MQLASAQLLAAVKEKINVSFTAPPAHSANSAACCQYMKDGTTCNDYRFLQKDIFKALEHVQMFAIEVGLEKELTVMRVLDGVLLNTFIMTLLVSSTSS